MIQGIGIDIVEIDRIKNITNKEKFLKRILHEKEVTIYQAYTNEKRKLEFLAGRFATKEAYSKALGTGIGDVHFKDICILNDASGKPYIKGRLNAFVSISHSDAYAVSMVVIEQIPKLK